MVITISRQYGSGGQRVGQMVAKKLGLPYYDKEVIELAAEQSGFEKKMFEEADKNASNSLLFSLSVFGGDMGAGVTSLADKVYLITADAIKKIASEGDCVIVGRCADYILKSSMPCMSIFLRASHESRVRRCVEEYGEVASNIEKVLEKKDKKRSVYYLHYTGEKWGANENYDMVLNTDLLGLENTADLIADAYKKSL